MSKYSLIIWDLDGTIIDPATGIIDSVKYALEKLGIEKPDHDVLRKFIGPPLAASFMEFTGLNDESAEEAVRLYRENFSGNGAMYKDSPFDGIPEVLKSVHEAGLTQIVATSKPTLFAEDLIRYHGLNDFFSHIQGSNMDGSGASKYDVIKEALRKAGHFNASETIVIGTGNMKLMLQTGLGLTRSS